MTARSFPAALRNSLAVPFDRVLTATVAATAGLILLGVYTAGVGAGLACGTRWPFCDGAVFGLFPATWPSFWEWAHRLVAMLTGGAILGVALLAWRTGQSRRVRLATTAAVLLLPLQILLGAITVRIEGLFPWGYSPPVQALHFSTALTIFTFLVVAAVSVRRPAPDRVRRGLLGATALVPLMALFGYGTLLTYTPTVQAIYYGLGLLAYALVVTAAVRAPTVGVRRLTGVAVAVFAVLLLLGRRLLGTLAPLYADVTTAVLLAVLVAAAFLAQRHDGDAPTPRPQESD